MNVTVIERPISVLGSRDIADRVAVRPATSGKAVRAAYAQMPPRAGRPATRGLDEPRPLRAALVFSGRRLIVRSDGAVLEGYRPKAALIAWL